MILQWRLARAYAALSEPMVMPARRWRRWVQAAKRAIELAADRVEATTTWPSYTVFQRCCRRARRDRFCRASSASRKPPSRSTRSSIAVDRCASSACCTRAPKEPVSVGDPEKAVQYMKRAVAAAPDYPPNQFFLPRRISPTSATAMPRRLW